MDIIECMTDKIIVERVGMFVSYDVKLAFVMIKLNLILMLE